MQRLKKFQRFVILQIIYLNSSYEESFLDFNDCFNRNTFNLQETIFHAYFGGKDDLLKNETNWIVNKANIHMGQCNTFQNPVLVKTEGDDNTKFALNPNISYDIILHDPKFYALLGNPMLFPRIWKHFKANKVSILQWARAERGLMN